MTSRSRSRPPVPVSAASVRLPDLLLRVVLGTAAFLAGTWWALDRIVAEKIATALLMPAGLLWLLLLTAVLAARRLSRTDMMVATALPWLALTVLGNSMFVESLATQLERDYMNIDPLKIEPMATVVVLGGGTIQGVSGRVQAHTSGDRVVLAAQLYHAGLVQRIVCTGRRIDQLAPGASHPGEQSGQLLVSLGVPKSAIQILDGRNTSEEMQILGQRYSGSSERIGLITSAWHLRRAMRLAERNGFHPVPLPADFISTPPGPRTTARMVLDCIPQDGALWTSSRLLKEYLGILVGR